MTRAAPLGHPPTTGPPAKVLRPAPAGLTVEVGRAVVKTVAPAAIGALVRIAAVTIAVVPGPVRKAVMGVTPVVRGSPLERASAMTVVGADSHPRAPGCPSPAFRTR